MHRDASGRELFVEQPRIGLALSVHDADAMQRTPRLNLGCDHPHRLANLAGAVGRAHDRGRRGHGLAEVGDGGEPTREPSDECGGDRIGIGLTREADDRPHTARDCERIDEAELLVREPMRQMQHDLPDVAKICSAVRNGIARGQREVAAVVEPSVRPALGTGRRSTRSHGRVG